MEVNRKYSFPSTKKWSSNLTIAEIYLEKRKKDYKKFISELDFYNNDEASMIHDFDNGYRVKVTEKGRINFIHPNGTETIKFDTFKQFAAYYLAKFW